MSEYIFSKRLATFLSLAEARMRRGMGATLLLEGPPGGGKSSFARAFADHLGGRRHYYSGAPDKERDLLYDYDVEGIVKREGAYVRGPAWEAFEASQRGEHAVLLLDEVDKTNPGFDAFLLRLLEDWTFRAPDGSEITADPSRIAVVLASNGRRKFPGEVLRRCQRIRVPFPTGERLRRIVRQVAGITISDGLLDLVIRIGDAVRADNEELAPSPKELALVCVDLLTLVDMGELDPDIWREVAASYLTKNGGPRHLDRVTGFRWARALRREA